MTEPMPSRTESLISRTLVALFVLLILALVSPAFFDQVHVGDDLGNLHLPVRGAYQAALQAHQSVLWSPHLYGGMYLHGEGQAGMYHPLHWLLYRFLPLRWGFTLEFVLSYAVMFPGMYLMLRRLELPLAAALFGALVFTFSGFNLLHFMHMNAIAVVAHLPWLLFWIDVLLRSADRRQVALAQLLISLGTGSQLLLGHPQFVWLSVLAELAFVAWRLRSAVSAWRVALLCWAVVLGALLGSIQILPTIEALGESERSNPSAEFRSTYSLHIANLLQLVSPYGLRGGVVGGNVQRCTLQRRAGVAVAPLAGARALAFAGARVGRLRGRHAGPLGKAQAITLDDRGRGIGGPVVHHNQLPVGERLVQDRFDRLGQVSLPVERRHNNRDRWRRHDRPDPQLALGGK